jgi:hypothetical protein
LPPLRKIFLSPMRIRRLPMKHKIPKRFAKQVLFKPLSDHDFEAAGITVALEPHGPITIPGETKSNFASSSFTEIVEVLDKGHAGHDVITARGKQANSSRSKK